MKGRKSYSLKKDLHNLLLQRRQITGSWKQMTYFYPNCNIIGCIQF